MLSGAGGMRSPLRQTVGANGGEGPPVPIPNTEVKLTCAEDTWLLTARENRSVPTQERKKTSLTGGFLLLKNFEKKAVKQS